jgi:hypothetical protein
MERSSHQSADCLSPPELVFGADSLLKAGAVVNKLCTTSELLVARLVGSLINTSIGPEPEY